MAEQRKVVISVMSAAALSMIPADPVGTSSLMFYSGGSRVLKLWAWSKVYGGSYYEAH